MFGYIRPLKPELKICEYEAYKAVYCGLCGQLGRDFGPVARLSLSFDFTFLSMLYLAVTGEDINISKRRCYVNPLKKSPCLKDCEALRFGSDIAIVTLYYKLLDNIADSSLPGKLGWSLLRPAAAVARKKAAAARPEAERIVRTSMERQASIEAGGCASLDEAADPTAQAMSELCGLIPCDEKTKRVLLRLGYLIGRFVYLCDALDDLEDDLAHGRYNPLIARFNPELSNKQSLDAARLYARKSVNMTAGEAAVAYGLLEPRAFKPILDNIIYLGIFSVWGPLND